MAERSGKPADRLVGTGLAECCPEPCRLHILVAEDNQVNQLLARRLLEKRGHSIEVADNGLEVLKALEKESFDLVLMDIQMPEMDGLAASRAIREREARQGGHVPIVAMTAFAMRGDREMCLAAGMDAYLAKPISSQMLYQTIAAVVIKRAE
ncbi:MAG: response regulator [Pseudomonadota bacterium]